MRLSFFVLLVLVAFTAHCASFIFKYGYTDEWLSMNEWMLKSTSGRFLTAVVFLLFVAVRYGLLRDRKTEK